MSRGINKAILVGNLGADPETKYGPSGDAIDEMLAGAWPDADPVTLGLLRGPLQTAAVVASMRLLVLLAAEGQP